MEFLPRSFLPACLVLLIYPSNVHSVRAWVVYVIAVDAMDVWIACDPSPLFNALSCAFADRVMLISYGDPPKGYYLFSTAIMIHE